MILSRLPKAPIDHNGTVCLSPALSLRCISDRCWRSLVSQVDPLYIHCILSPVLYQVPSPEWSLDPCCSLVSRLCFYQPVTTCSWWNTPGRTSDLVHHLLCVSITSSAQLITFKPSGTAPLCWRHCPGWGIARLLAPTLVIPWQTLASGFYYRLRKIRRAYRRMTLESGHPKHLCPLWRVSDLTKQEFQQRRSQPFKSSSLAIPPSWTVAWPCSQLNDLDRTHQIFFQSEFQKYQWFKTFLEPSRSPST